MRIEDSLQIAAGASMERSADDRDSAVRTRRFFKLCGVRSLNDDVCQEQAASEGPFPDHQQNRRDHAQEHE